MTKYQTTFQSRFSINDHRRQKPPTLTQDLTLLPFDNRRLADLCGKYDEHLRYLERSSGVEIINRGNVFHLTGEARQVEDLKKVLQTLYEETKGGALSMEGVHLALRQPRHFSKTEHWVGEEEVTLIKTRGAEIKPRTPNQRLYLNRILRHDMNFGIGPAGTGKTYLAVACAVMALEQEWVRRILLVRPAVEAGERLGFLPGDLTQKIDPYLRPLYDALYDMLGFERVAKWLERQVIEIAPLAYMRGRTLNDAFIILDESQNTTQEQMKMFLTRMGFNSRVVITGDITQVDLPRGKQSGLRHALKVLKGLTEISFTHFQSIDVVRHPVVQKIVEAYDRLESETHGPEVEPSKPPGLP